MILALATCGCVFAQYVLGGLVRHRGMVLYEHLGFAFVVALMTIWLAMSAAASGIRWLRGPAALLALLTIVQLGLGGGAWVTKFGFGGYVAVYGSLVQDMVRTSHVLCGMLLFVTSVILNLRVARLEWLSHGTASAASALSAFDRAMQPAGGPR